MSKLSNLIPPDEQVSFWSGVLDPETNLDLISVPPEDLWREKRAGLVVIECPQEIPCNPCHTSCPTGAITVEPLTAIPKVNYDLCTGCTICVSKCPGLACFVIDKTPADHSIVKLPYEMYPVPKVGEVVDCLDRTGRPVVEGEVLNVTEPSRDGTKVVWVKVPKGFEMTVRAIKVKRGE